MRVGAIWIFGLLLPAIVPARAAEGLAVNVRDFGAKGDGRSDDTAALQRAFGGGGRTVSIPPGVYLVRGLQLDSDTVVEAAPDAVIRLADHAARGPGDFLLQNRDEAGGSHDITVRGGIWDGNNLGNPRGLRPPCYTGVALNFANLRRLALFGLIVRNPESFAIRCWKLTGFRMEDIGFDESVSRSSQDGIHLNGYCEDGEIRNIRALSPWATNDDLIALNADDATGGPPWIRVMCQGDVLGPIRHIRIEHVRAHATYTFVRLLSSTHPIEDVSIEDVAGGCRACAINLHLWHFPAGTGRIRNVTLRDFVVHKVADPLRPSRRIEAFPLIEIQSVVHNLRIENFRRDDAGGPSPAPTLLLDNGRVNRVVLRGFDGARLAPPQTRSKFILPSGGFSLLQLDSVPPSAGKGAVE